MADNDSTIPGVTTKPFEGTANSGALVYVVPGNSTQYGWKLAPGSSGILWTDESYNVLPSCVCIEFDDIAVELGPDGQTRTRFHGEGEFKPSEAEAVSLENAPPQSALPSGPEIVAVELDEQLIPNQMDEIGAEISFDIGSFLTNNMMQGEVTLALHGMPSGLVYNSARM